MKISGLYTGLIDLSHVNTALYQRGAKRFEGIIDADV